MYLFATQTLIRDHITQVRQAAAAARRGSAERSSRRKPARRYSRIHRVVRGA